MPITLAIAVLIATMFGLIGYALVRGPFALRFIVFLVIAFAIFIGELLFIGISGY